MFALSLTDKTGLMNTDPKGVERARQIVGQLTDQLRVIEKYEHPAASSDWSGEKLCELEL